MIVVKELIKSRVLVLLQNIKTQGFNIEIYTEDFKNDYISLTDIARYKNKDAPRFVIQNWMRNRNTLEFIGLWEILNNKDFNRVQFYTFKTEVTEYLMLL